MLERTWPLEGATRVPDWVDQDADLYRDERVLICWWPGRRQLSRRARDTRLREPFSVDDVDSALANDPDAKLIEILSAECDAAAAKGPRR